MSHTRSFHIYFHYFLDYLKEDGSVRGSHNRKSFVKDSFSLLLIYLQHFYVQQGQNWPVVGLFQLGSPIPVHGSGTPTLWRFFRHLSSPPEDAICPSGNAAFLGRVVIVGEKVVLVCRGKIDGAFVESLEHVPGLLFNLELVRGEECHPVLLRNQGFHVLSCHVDAVVEIPAPEDVVVT